MRVLAIGQLIEAKDGKKLAEGNTATLELTPAQAQRLAEANAGGEISLSLRSIADMETKDGPAVARRGETIRIIKYGVKSGRMASTERECTSIRAGKKVGTPCE